MIDGLCQWCQDHESCTRLESLNSAPGFARERLARQDYLRYDIEPFRNKNLTLLRICQRHKETFASDSFYYCRIRTKLQHKMENGLFIIKIE